MWAFWTGPLCPVIWCPSHGSPIPLLTFQTAPRHRLLRSSGSKKKDPNRCVQVKARNQFSSLSLSTDKTPPHCHMLVVHRAFYLFSYILPRNPQDQFMSNKLADSSISCELAALSFPHTLQWPGTQNNPTECLWEWRSKLFGTIVPMGMLFWQPQGLPKPPDCQSKY